MEPQDHQRNESPIKLTQQLQKKWKNKVKGTMQQLDWFIIIIVVILMAFGLISVFSATMYNNPISYITTQFLAILIGTFIITATLIIPFELLENLHLILILSCAVDFLLLLTLLFGEENYGARSWLTLLGFNFQSSEFMKISSILLLAWQINYSNREEILSKRKYPQHLMPIFLIILVMGLTLIVLQPDIGMVAIIVGTLFLTDMLLKGSLKRNVLTYGSIMVVYALMFIVATQFGDWLVSQNYHFLDRIAVFVNPFRYPSIEGYQIIEGFKAISAGGWFGVGLGNGQAKNGPLPVIESDYIIANIGEEFGFIGIIVLICLFFALILFLYQRAARSSSLYRRCVITGVASSLMIQTILNLAGLASLLPLTGVTLPFVSYGGTSMIVSLSLIGLALRMIAEDRKEPQISLVYSRNKGGK